MPINFGGERAQASRSICLRVLFFSIQRAVERVQISQPFRKGRLLLLYMVGSNKQVLMA